MDSEAERLRDIEELRAEIEANKAEDKRIRSEYYARAEAKRKDSKERKQSLKDRWAKFKASPEYTEYKLQRSEAKRKRFADPDYRRTDLDKIKIRLQKKLEALAGRPKPTTCELCGGIGGKKGIVFDHAHDSNVFRGWLCNYCNVAIGMAMDDPELLEKMARYVRGEHEANIKSNNRDIQTHEDTK